MVRPALSVMWSALSADQPAVGTFRRMTVGTFYRLSTFRRMAAVTFCGWSESRHFLQLVPVYVYVYVVLDFPWSLFMFMSCLPVPPSRDFPASRDFPVPPSRDFPASRDFPVPRSGDFSANRCHPAFSMDHVAHEP